MSTLAPISLAIGVAVLVTGCAGEPESRLAATSGPAISADRSVNISSLPARDLPGLTERELGLAFGPPSLRRREAGAEYWHYAEGDCVLDLFLYADPDSAHHRVVYYEYRSRLDTSPASACGTSLHNIHGSIRDDNDLPLVEVH